MSALTQVLQVNVRLSEGGAAGVARTLADTLTANGIASPFAYGYSKGGRASPLENEYDAVRITPKPVAAVNRLAYSVVGRESRIVSGRHWRNLRAAIDDADVVHLHAIHSHIVDLPVLVDALIDARKPVVWTLHDQWIMTGRCAQPGTCRLWESGCQKCPDLQAYPPAVIDMAAPRWVDRRRDIERLQAAVPVALVACAEWLADEARQASFSGVETITNSVDPLFWSVTRSRHTSKRERPTRNLFMCRDLRDDRKVDWELLRTIASIDGQSLTIVGSDAPQRFAGPRWVDAISDRADLATEMMKHDRLIFTSRIDYFPLTITEALVAGLEVYAVDSQAAREFQRHPAVRIFSSTGELEAAAREDKPAQRGQDDVAVFDPERMAADYVAVYKRLVSETKR
ncbi:glycosyltransferase [Marisediminicola sp. LYQ85]|uniref:glycosyltransferase n=1 Tax=Marisediminicola sp. LYQ85 TaxID=3391062 RepID=UPI003983B2AE